MTPTLPHWPTVARSAFSSGIFSDSEADGQKVSPARKDNRLLRADEKFGRRNEALRGFKRLMIYLAVAATIMVIAALFYLSSTGALTPTLVITVTIGVFVSIVLGGGLMAAGFFSADSGHDDDVAGASNQEPPSISETES